ncbi:hypothetical protein DSO57_1028426 [Entomophthora muscae]|uniref:Uncharacterized protein n=1 Tax=Entomophthora muscae TaxID=34485 RepID=A0ACC2RSE8_9FUNG|nr:hypothetical protein DSO57_1028426 [Entomophthora muscae]
MSLEKTPPYRPGLACSRGKRVSAQRHALPEPYRRQSAMLPREPYRVAAEPPWALPMNAIALDPPADLGPIAHIWAYPINPPTPFTRISGEFN